MAARQFNTTVGTSATVIAGTQYPHWILHNNTAAVLYVGDSAVTTTNGFPIPASSSFTVSDVAHASLRGRDAERLFGIVAAATNDVRVLIQGRINV